jgi:Fic family protein
VAKQLAKTPADRGEVTSLMEPLSIADSSRHRPELTDLCFDLVHRSAAFRSSLPPSLVDSLATLVRSMNCYYSNLIEGHDTHPVEIERALRQDYSKNARQRDLQQEARAHIAVQQWIDDRGLRERATSLEGIREIHRRFCELLPQDLLFCEDPHTKQRIPVEPGALRTRDVEVGRHLAISPGAVPRFLERFDHVYSLQGKADAVLSTAASHHRLLWIHPFIDGNGRVARLMSHAILLQHLDSGAVWSVARGLARNVGTYKELLANCDQQRRNDLDGRGNLSEEALVAFTRFFLGVCIDQVSFMQELMQPDLLRTRIQMWAEEEMRLGKIPSKSDAILGALLYRGELPRGDAASIIGASDRTATRVVSALVQRGVLISTSTRAPLRLAFPATLASRWMPGLFPDRTA